MTGIRGGNAVFNRLGCVLMAIVLLTSTVAFGARVVLNEYNCVSSGKTLKEGGTDSYFGLVDGNGGEWFELVVIEDVDMRNWSLRWMNAENTDYEGTITLSDNTFWSDVRAGTIITFIEDGTANGGKDTDKEINHADDWWINICTEEQQDKYLKNKNWLTRVEPQNQTGEIKVNSENWILYIYDAQGQLEFGPGGEGEYVANGKGKVGSGEIFYLCEDPSSHIVPHSRYLDGCASTFGSPNVGSLGDEGLPELLVQDFSVFWGAPCNCEQVLEMGFSLAGDLNNDCRVDFIDFAVFAPHWLACIDPENPDSDWPWTEQQEQRTPLIVNEFNCVSRDNYLDSELYSDEGKIKGLEVDSYFASVNPAGLDGRIQGNGGNWIELVATQDHLDIRGWRVLMVATNTDKAPNANGTDLLVRGCTTRTERDYVQSDGNGPFRTTGRDHPDHWRGQAYWY